MVSVASLASLLLLLNMSKKDDIHDNIPIIRTVSGLPEVGSVYGGEVVGIIANGAFVMIPEYCKEGLVHISQISTQRLSKVSDVLQEGDVVFCKVMEIDSQNRIRLSMIDVDQSHTLDESFLIANGIIKCKREAEERAKQAAEEAKLKEQEEPAMPELNSIVMGRVERIADFGAFVAIRGYPVIGLVHISQITTHRLEKVSDALQEGLIVFCKVIEIDSMNRISLSMKDVDQSSGKPLK